MIKQLKCFGVLVVAASLWISCDRPADKALKEVRAAEAVLYQSEDKKVDPKKAKEMLAQYDHYITTYPDSKAIPDLLFKSGELQMSIKQWVKATGFFHKITKDYPDWDRAPEAAFYIAYSFDLGYKNLHSPKLSEYAHESYLQFIKQYPDHELVDDAKAAMEVLTMSDEDLIKKFREQNNK